MLKSPSPPVGMKPNSRDLKGKFSKLIMKRELVITMIEQAKVITGKMQRHAEKACVNCMRQLGLNLAQSYKTFRRLFRHLAMSS